MFPALKCAIFFFGWITLIQASLFDYLCEKNGIAARKLEEINQTINSDIYLNLEETIDAVKNILASDYTKISEERTLGFSIEKQQARFLPSSSSLCDGSASTEEDSNILFSAIMSIILTFCASLASGLTMGLVSIEPLEMAIKLRSGTPDEMVQAERILPLVTRHHFLLVSLLLFNSLAFEALPIFLDNIFNPAVSVILSVTLILFLGEILPSAIFTGPNQMRLAAILSPIVWIIMVVFAPLSWPIGKALDLFLGVEEFKRYNRAEISALVEVQHDIFHTKKEIIDLESGDGEESEDPLHEDEVNIVLGVLGVGLKEVKDAMITYDNVFSLNINQSLDAECMASIMASGHSRIPIYEGEERRNIRGYLQVKKLIVLSPDDARCIRSLVLRIPEIVSPHESLLELLNRFQTGASHIALVSENPDGTVESLKKDIPLEGDRLPIGIICLEDILEEILQEEIFDETDLRRNAAESRAKKIIAKYAKRKVSNYQKMIATVPKMHLAENLNLKRKLSRVALLTNVSGEINETTPLQPKRSSV